MQTKIKKTKKRKIRKSKKIKKTKSKSNKIYKNPAVNLTPHIIYQSPLTQTMAPIESKENFNKIISLQNDVDNNKIQLLNRLDDEKRYFESMGQYVLNEIKQLENKPLNIKDLEVKPKRTYTKKVKPDENEVKPPKPLTKKAQNEILATIKREAKAKAKKEKEDLKIKEQAFKSLIENVKQRKKEKPQEAFKKYFDENDAIFKNSLRKGSDIEDNIRKESDRQVQSYEVHKAIKEREAKNKSDRLANAAKDKKTRENFKNDVAYPEYEEKKLFNHENLRTLSTPSKRDTLLSPVSNEK